MGLGAEAFDVVILFCLIHKWFRFRFRNCKSSSGHCELVEMLAGEIKDV